jgi:hypothetical protein
MESKQGRGEEGRRNGGKVLWEVEREKTMEGIGKRGKRKKKTR